jgi:predicted ferric reductase
MTVRADAAAGVPTSTSRSGGGSTSPRRARRAGLPPLPRIWPVTSIDVLWLIGLNAILIAAMWVRHGGLQDLGAAGALQTAIGQLTGLYAAYLALLQLVLMSRSPWLDQLFGMDRLAWAHRWLGFATVWLIVVHGIFTTVGYALGDNVDVISELWTLLTTYAWVLPAAIGGILFIAVGISSMAGARRSLSYETWFLLHLLAYAAIALAFLHQLLVGNDFMHDPIARIYWIALYVGAAALVLVFRFGQPLALNARHRFEVGRVVREAPGLTSIYVTGRDLHRLPVRSGQYFVFRFLHGPEWWHGHPFSLSSAPNGRWLRITIKALGDGSRRLQTIPEGTRVLLEGPYGAMTGARRSRRKVALIAGGIGIAPLRALLEALPGKPGDLTLVYRARGEKHVIFRDELELLAASRGATVHYVVGRRGSTELPYDPLDAYGLEDLIPDIAARDVYVCGPIPMIDRVTDALVEVGVPIGRIHAERFAYL